MAALHCDDTASLMPLDPSTKELYASNGMSVPNHYEGKVDPGIPIYVSGSWSRGVGGDPGLKAVFKTFQEAGFGSYRWDLPAHTVHGSADQVASQRAFLSGPCKAFVMLAEDNKYAEAPSTSGLYLGRALLKGNGEGEDMRVYFVDPLEGTWSRPGRANKHHPMVSNVVAQAALETGMLRIVKTVEEAIVFMKMDLGVVP